MSETTGPAFADLESEEELDELMTSSEVPVVIDFWSPTCGPCLAMADDFAHVAAQFDPEEIRFCKINVGTHGHLGLPFQVRSVPTIIFAHRGQVLDAVVGKLNARQLGEKAEWLVKKASGKGLWSRLFG